MTDNINITFPDGNSREFPRGINGLEIAKHISKSLAKEAIALKINGRILDLSQKN